MSERPPRRPTAIRLGEPEAEARVVLAPEPAIEDELPPPPPPRKRRGPWWTLLLASAGALASLAVGLSVARLVDELFARSDWLGVAGLALVALLVVAVVAIVGREVRAVLRLGRVEALRARALATLAEAPGADGAAVAADLRAIYAGRPDLARARAQLDRDLSGIMDGADRVRLAERALMAELDARAVRMVMESAKRVSIVTAISPRALFDVLIVISESARLTRRLAELYGARPGGLGFVTLGRRVLGQLVVTGGMAAGESLVQQLVGHGLAARLSAKLGEGVVNGLMTARVGLATIDLVRPLPFTALERPKLGAVVAELTRVG
jgi:putative membrane protein